MMHLGQECLAHGAGVVADPNIVGVDIGGADDDNSANDTVDTPFLSYRTAASKRALHRIRQLCVLLITDIPRRRRPPVAVSTAESGHVERDAGVLSLSRRAGPWLVWPLPLLGQLEELCPSGRHVFFE